MSPSPWGHCANVNARIPALEGQDSKPAGLLYQLKARWEIVDRTVWCQSRYCLHVAALGAMRGTALVAGVLQQTGNAVKMCVVAAQSLILDVLRLCAEFLTATWPIAMTFLLLTSLGASAAAAYFYARRRTGVENDAPPLPDGFDDFEDFEIILGMLTQLYESEEAKHVAVRGRFEGLRARNLQVAAAYEQLARDNQELLERNTELRSDNAKLIAECAAIRAERDRCQSASDRRLQFESGRLQAEIARLREELQRVQNECRALEEEVSNARAIIEVLQG